MFSWRFLVVSVNCSHWACTPVCSCAALELHLLTVLNAAQCKQLVKKTWLLAKRKQSSAPENTATCVEIHHHFSGNSPAFWGWTVLLRMGPHLMGSQFLPLGLGKRSWDQSWKRGSSFLPRQQIQPSRWDCCHDIQFFTWRLKVMWGKFSTRANPVSG